MILKQKYNGSNAHDSVHVQIFRDILIFDINCV